MSNNPNRRLRKQGEEKRLGVGREHQTHLKKTQKTNQKKKNPFTKIWQGVGGGKGGIRLTEDRENKGKKRPRKKNQGH